MATRILLAVAWLISIAWLLLLASAPRWISPPSTGPAHAIAVATYMVGSRICHQRPERSFRLDAVPVPVCARCAGLYLGIPIGIAFAGWRPRAAASRTPVSDRAARTALAWAALPTVATVGLEWLTGFVLPAMVRFGLGVMVAGVAAWVCAGRLVAEAGPGR
jgi:hypothetical protein